MKKQKLLNFLMILIVLSLCAAGLAAALALREDSGYVPGSSPMSSREMGQEEQPEPGQGVCTIAIRCDAILSSWDSLNPEKAAFVPADGIILPETRVSFSPGETVFDVLSRVCGAAEIPLEYAYTPLYGSYYIEGIHHLYEFDCGPQSGWMYRVDGVFPNYGCSSCALEDGQDILWCYTCTGLGTDVGRELPEE